MNATTALAAIGLGSFLLGMVLGRQRARTVETHPVGGTPIPHPPGADRLSYYRAQVVKLPRGHRLVAICELHRDELIDTYIACTLIDEVT